MFGKKPLLAKKRASKVAHHMITVVDAVEKLISHKGMHIEGNTILIYRLLLTCNHAPKDFVKNLYLYCRLKEILKENQTLYIKDIESNNVIAQYTNEKALLFL